MSKILIRQKVGEIVSIVQKASDAVSGNVALTAFQTAIRQQVEFKEAVEKTKEREREAEAQRQRDQEECASRIAENASGSDSVNDEGSQTLDGNTSTGSDERGSNIDLNV